MHLDFAHFRQSKNRRTEEKVELHIKKILTSSSFFTLNGWPEEINYVMQLFSSFDFCNHAHMRKDTSWKLTQCDDMHNEQFCEKVSSGLVSQQVILFLDVSFFPLDQICQRVDNMSRGTSRSGCTNRCQYTYQVQKM